jgi:hypothetical protein
MCAAIGVAIVATYLAAFLPGDEGEGVAPVDQVAAFQGALLVAAAIAACGVVAAWHVRDIDAIGTMRRREDAAAAPIAH